jgi:hypothetical protein
MYYAGFSVMFNSQPWDMHFNIIYAWSLDGIHWNKKTDFPALAVNPSQNWEDEFVQDPKVLKIGSVYHMWYGAKGSLQGGQQIGHATSRNGINWMRSSSSPLISTGGSGAWDEFLCSFPTVVYKDLFAIYGIQVLINILPMHYFPIIGTLVMLLTLTK